MHVFSSGSVLGVVALVSILIAVIVGFLLIGSPAEARKEKLDQERVADLQTIAYAVRTFYEENDSLPISLDTAELTTLGPRSVTDPETGEIYGYSAIDSTRFELCSTFSLPSEERSFAGIREKGIPDFSTHPAGEHCFDVGVER